MRLLLLFFFATAVYPADYETVTLNSGKSITGYYDKVKGTVECVEGTVRYTVNVDWHDVASDVPTDPPKVVKVVNRNTKPAPDQLSTRQALKQILAQSEDIENQIKSLQEQRADLLDNFYKSWILTSDFSPIPGLSLPPDPPVSLDNAQRQINIMNSHLERFQAMKDNLSGKNSSMQYDAATVSDFMTNGMLLEVFEDLRSKYGSQLHPVKQSAPR